MKWIRSQGPLAKPSPGEPNPPDRSGIGVITFGPPASRASWAQLPTRIREQAACRAVGDRRIFAPAFNAGIKGQARRFCPNCGHGKRAQAGLLKAIADISLPGDAGCLCQKPPRRSLRTSKRHAAVISPQVADRGGDNIKPRAQGVLPPVPERRLPVESRPTRESLRAQERKSGDDIASTIAQESSSAKPCSSFSSVATACATAPAPPPVPDRHRRAAG